MGLFSGLALKGVAVGGGRALDFRGEGDFVVEVTEVKGGETRKREKYFEVIHKIVDSTNEAEQPVGSTTNLFCMLGGTAADLGQKNMKEILSVMSGLNPYVAQDVSKINEISDEKWIEIAELACADQTVFRGTKIRVSVTIAKTKSASAKRAEYLARRYTPHEDTVSAMNAAAEPAKAAKGTKK